MWTDDLELPEGRAFHTSSEPLPSLEMIRAFCSRTPQHIDTKPTGLWYGDGNSWLEWMETEALSRLEDVRYVYELHVSPDILRITDGKQLREFHNHFEGRSSPAVPRFPELLRGMHIDWAAVAEEYPGIQIIPYQWENRHSPDMRWYYGWDVASGCIWHPAGIEGVKLFAAQFGWPSRGKHGNTFDRIDRSDPPR